MATPRNRVHAALIAAAAVTGLVAAGAPIDAQAAAIVSSQAVDQYDFAFGSNSVFGRYSVDVDGDATDIEYLNLVARDASLNEHWLVRNLPILPTPLNPLGTVFSTGIDLSPFTASGTDLTSLEFGTSLSTAPSTSAPAVVFSVGAVGDALFDAEGKAGAGGPHADAGGSPAALGFLTFNLNNIIHVLYRPGFPNVEAGVNECGPAAAANSLQWLHDEQGLKVPDTLEERLDTLRGTMETDPVNGTLDRDFVEGKVAYAESKGVGSLIIKFMDDEFGEENIGRARGRGLIPTTDFIFDELNAGEDVEIGFTFLDAAGNANGGHWVTAVGKFELFGNRGIWFVEDTDQGNAGGTGAVGFSWIGTNGGFLELSNYPSRHRIDIVVSESVIEPGTLGVFVGGLAALFALGSRVRRRRA
jgi:hypothetical protein